jgi:hypothetical protein
MATERITYYSIDELPAVFNVDVLQDIMGISRALAYDLVNQDDFPKL